MKFKLISTLFVLAAMANNAWAETWDAYTQFNINSNTSSDLWQYFKVTTQGTNAGYTLLDAQNPSLLQSYQITGWGNSAASTFYYLPYVGARGGTYNYLSLSGGQNGSAAAIGWKSPITGTVDVTFSLTNWESNPGTIAGTYYLFAGNDTVALASGTIGNGVDTTTGSITVTNIAVTAGEMLYLQSGPGSDINGDSQRVTLTVKTVPEPSAIAMTGVAIVGLLAYAWRKRRK